VLPVEIVPVQETLVLRARGSELLILPHHIRHLKGCEKPKDFSEYFRAEALVNRPARKLFEAWLRKDDTLWKRIYLCVHKEMELKNEADASDEKAPKKAEPKAKAKEEPKAVKAETKPAKAEAKPAKVEAKAPKAEAKPAAKPKAEPAAKKKEEAKPAAKAKTEEKPAKKVVAKKAAKADDDKPAAKKKTATKAAPAGTAKKKKG
jgi:hypothetical protein